MNDPFQNLFAKEMSDETVSHLSDFLYDLALAFESHYYSQIKRYHKSIYELREDLMDQNKTPPLPANKEPETFPL